MFKKYDNCIYCNSKKLRKLIDQSYIQNFYLKAIKSDLNLSNQDLNKIKIHECERCKIMQNNPWFEENISQKIYNSIYGQHHRGWSNLLNFVNKGITPDHGKLFDIIIKKLKIRKYAEYSNPFNGLMLNFFSREYKKDITFYKNLSLSIIGYLTSRQSAGKEKKFFISAETRANRFLKRIKYLKKKNFKKSKIEKFLFRGDNNLSWGQNDNYKSVNSKSYATELLDMKILDINNKYSNFKTDLFGIFHTLDHTFQPNKVLEYALNKSKYVIVYSHIDKKLNKQHLFSLTKNFLNYLTKKKIYIIDLTDKIQKNFKSPELYFICSKKKFTLT
jgi:hypothetical protein